MNNTSCKRVIKFIIPLALLASCGAGLKTNQSTIFSSTEAMSTSEIIDSDQRNIATRICYAYESKGNNFLSTDYLGGKFKFAINNSTCESTTSYSINSTLVRGVGQSLSFLNNTNTSLKFSAIIQTNVAGYLVNLCKSIKSNAPIINTINKGNVVVQISFFKDGLDAYALKYFVADANGSYKINSSEIFKVRTSSNFSNGQILGMDETYIAQGVCTSSSKNYSFTQNFSSFSKN
jgi:hypothetical protein